jgi:hypothetical protein
MDVKGARHLEARIAEQAHWEQADSVRSGAQPPRDPDLAELQALGAGLRVYGEEQVAGAVRSTLVKRLIRGRWETTLQEPPAQQIS